MTDRTFGPFLAGRVMSSCGVWIQSLASTVLMYDLTGSALMVGTVSILQFTGLLTLTPWSGQLNDRFDRRKLLIGGRVLSGVTMGLLALLVALRGVEAFGGPAVLLAAVFLGGIGFAVSAPAQQALMPALVPPEDLEPALAINSAGPSIARTVGPALGAALLLLGGPALAFAVASLGHWVFAAVLTRVRGRPQQRPKRRPRLLGGLRYVVADRNAGLLLIAIALLGFGADPAVTLTPPLADQLGGGSETVGLFVASYGCGAVLLTFLFNRVRRYVSLRMAGLLGFWILAAGLLVLALSASVQVAVAGFAVAGVGFMMSTISLNTRILRRVPDEVRGRVMALWSMAFAGSRPFAALANGAIADFGSLQLAVLVSAAVVLGASLLARGTYGQPPPSGVEERPKERTAMVSAGTKQAERFDVIVVGGATAGFSTAIAAAENGAERVLLLEKAPRPEAGGNAVVSHTGFRFVQRGAEEIREFLPGYSDEEFARFVIRAYPEERFTADLQRVTRGRIDENLARILVSQSNAALHWMLDLGFEWAPTPQGVVVDGYKYFEPGLVIHPDGGGPGQYHRWLELGRERGLEIRFESAVEQLLGSRRAIEGVRVAGPEGSYEVTAPSVVLAAGGFQANREMRARYLGQNADLMRVRGSRHDTGEVLRQALDLGASPAGHWQGAHATQIDANAAENSAGGPGGANRYSYAYGITVNSLGVRFYDEGEAEHAYTYAKTGWNVVRQDGGMAYQIFDQKTLHLLTSRYAKAEPVTADTIEELAAGIGVEPEVLAHTVAEFNAAVDEDTPFNPGERDGRSTSGLAINKRNWALGIDEPPFVAYPVTGGVTFTFGGVEIDGEARVQNTSGQPVEGLFANGDIVGLFFHNYPSCSGQTRNAVFGRIAGRSAAAHAASRAGGAAGNGAGASPTLDRAGG